MEKVKEPVVFTGECVPVQRDMSEMETQLFKDALKLLIVEFERHGVKASATDNPQWTRVEKYMRAIIKTHVNAISKRPKNAKVFVQIIADDAWEMFEGMFV